MVEIVQNYYTIGKLLVSSLVITNLNFVKKDAMSRRKFEKPRSVNLGFSPKREPDTKDED